MPVPAGGRDKVFSVLAGGSSGTFLASGIVLCSGSTGAGGESRVTIDLIRCPAVCTARWRSLIGGVTVVGNCGQATKGAGWMSWHREATKDAVACEKLREAGKRALIRRSPNEETRLGNPQSLTAERIGGVGRTRGTETSHYPQEKKETSIPSVAASESGTAQTGVRPGVVDASS